MLEGWAGPSGGWARTLGALEETQVKAEDVARVAAQDVSAMA